MEHIKILDELLKYLSETEHTQFAYIRSDINNKSEFLKDYDNDIIHSALLKLGNDGFVNVDSKESSDRIFNTPRTDYYYKISFDGIFFIKNGGYKKQNSEKLKKEAQYTNIQTEQRNQASALVRLNRWMVFGAIVVAIDSILNILHFFGVYFDTNNFIFCIKPN